MMSPVKSMPKSQVFPRVFSTGAGKAETVFNLNIINILLMRPHEITIVAGVPRLRNSRYEIAPRCSTILPRHHYFPGLFPYALFSLGNAHGARRLWCRFSALLSHPVWPAFTFRRFITCVESLNEGRHVHLVMGDGVYYEYLAGNVIMTNKDNCVPVVLLVRLKSHLTLPDWFCVRRSFAK